MARIVDDWRVELMRAHPRLFEIVSGEPERSLGYPRCGDGWQHIMSRLVERVAAASNVMA